MTRSLCSEFVSERHKPQSFGFGRLTVRRLVQTPFAGELRRGGLDQVYIRGTTGHVLVVAVGEEAVLTTLAREDAKLGLVLLDMRRAAEDLAKLL